jgi:PAS domain S-box-containing protein
MVTIHAFKTEERARIHSLLFASAAEGLVVTDRKGCICLINPRMNELFGYEGEALLGQSIDVLLPQAMRARHAGHRADYMASPRQRSMGSGYKLLGQRSDGTVFPVEVSLNHLTVDGEVYAMGLVTDITLRKQAEEALQRTNAELEQRVEQRTAALLQAENELRQALEKEKELNALKSRFVSMASHEFRTPLSTILSSVDLIGRYTEGQD